MWVSTNSVVRLDVYYWCRYGNLSPSREGRVNMRGVKEHWGPINNPKNGCLLLKYSSTVPGVVGKSNLPSLASSLPSHSEDRICLSLVPRVRQTFFLHQIVKESTNYVFLEVSIRIQTRPKRDNFDRPFLYFFIFFIILYSFRAI